MKKSIVLAVSGLISLAGVSSDGAAVSLQGSRPMVLPVLVRVTAKGDVTNISPARQLTPRFDRLLHTDLRALQVMPAREHGHAVPRQIVINLALKFESRENGRYRARFAYVSTTPIPSGSWYWVHLDNDRLALAQRGFAGSRPAIRYRHEPRQLHDRSGLWNAPSPQVFQRRPSDSAPASPRYGGH